MRKDERKTLCKIVAAIGIGIILWVYLYTLPVSAKKAVFTDFDDEVEEFTVCDTESPEKGEIREDSGMPCENREQFERWLETYEQTASEEDVDVFGRDENLSEVSVSETRCSLSETETEAVQETVPATKTIYSVDGQTLNPELQALLYDALDRHGISYFWEIALAQCYQESHFNIYAINPHNNEDMGVLQYKSRYWDWNRGDIFDPAAQFELYAEQMAARLNAGLSAEECISRHNTSDFVTTINWEYVEQVKQHLSNIREVNQ